MDKHFQAVKKYVASPAGKELIIGISAVIGFVLLVIIVALFIQNSGPKIVYQPTVACGVFTEQKAKEMLGDQTLHQTPDDPTLQDNVATSKCSYTDRNPDQDQMLVAAVAVRSGVNDKGADKNKREFAAAKLNQGMQSVEQLGDSAFFNPQLGQLDVLRGRDWIIVSYGIGASPQRNTLTRAIELAQKILGEPELPTF